MHSNAGNRTLAWAGCGLRIGAVLAAEIAMGFGLHEAVAPVLLDGHGVLGAAETGAGAGTLSQLVVFAAALLAELAFALLVVSTVLALLLAPMREAIGPTRLIQRSAGPPWWSRAVLAACGLSLAAPAAATATPATAWPRDHCVVDCADRAASSSVLSGLRLPDLPDLPPQELRPARTRIVRPGDSLWLIARETLATSASDPSICRAVEALYAANRRVIGPDPNLIFPGTELTQPGGTA